MTRAEKVEEAARALLAKWFEAEPAAEIEAMRAALALPNDQATAESMLVISQMYLEEMNATAVKLSNDLRACLDVLREVEWAGNQTVIGTPDARTVAYECPACGGRKSESKNDAWAGHDEDCKLAAVLAGAPHCPVCGGPPLPGMDGKHLCPTPKGSP